MPRISPFGLSAIIVGSRYSQSYEAYDDCQRS